MVNTIWDFYVDCFMIWLLYKFRCPNRNQPDSCILYAHDHLQAAAKLKENLLDQKDEIENDKIKDQIYEYLAYLSKELSNSAQLESQIGQEFIDPAVRETFNTTKIENCTSLTRSEDKS